MHLIVNEKKQRNEQFIIKHLMELNNDNDSVAIEVDDNTVKVYPNKGHDKGVLYLSSKHPMHLQSRQDKLTPNEEFPTAETSIVRDFFITVRKKVRSDFCI